MNTKCRLCDAELPLTRSKAGLLIPSKKYCEACGKARGIMVNRLRDDKLKLEKHYKHLKIELTVIEKLKELIKLGEDLDSRTKEFLQNGKKYWEGYNLAKYYTANGGEERYE